MENNSRLRAAFAAGQKAQKAADLMTYVNEMIETDKDHLAQTSLDQAADYYDVTAEECDRAEWPERAAEFRIEAARARKTLAEIQAKYPGNFDATLALFS